MFSEVGIGLAVLGVFVLLIKWRDWLSRQRALRRCGKLIPGPPPIPFLGNILDVGLNTKELLGIVQALIKKYGPTGRLWIGPVLFVLLADAVDIEMVLNSAKNLSKSFNYRFLHCWLGQGLLTSTGDRWRKHRKIITPTFHFKILEDFNGVFNAQGDVLVEVLRKKVGRGSFDVTPFIDCYTQDVICETAMGVQLHSQRDENSSTYTKAVKEQCEILTARSTQPWYFPDFIFNLSPMGMKQKRNIKILHDFTNEVIAKKKKMLDEQPGAKDNALLADEMGVKRRLAFLDYLLLSSEDSAVLTNEDIREEVDTFMFEGHDTTAAAISFAIYELSKHPEIEEEVYRELIEVCGHLPDNERFATDVLGELKYLERVIKETLRLYPSVPIIGREIVDPVYLPSIGVEVPAGVTLTVAPYALHRNPKYYPNPDEFNPDNFLPEKVEQRHRFAYVPFSAGFRNCIGQKFAMLEMKSVLSKLFWNFSIKLEPGFVPKIVPEITLKSWNGIRISISQRKK